MSSQRWPATLHQGETQQQIEVSADAQTLILHVAGKKQKWPFTEVKYRSGGVPRFEHGKDLLIVPDHKMVESIEMLNPQAVSAMEQGGGGFLTAQDFLSGLLAVLVVMGAALVLVAAIWFFRTH